MKQHPTPGEFRKRLIYLDLVGCGGTGSLLLSDLARLHVDMLGLGHPHGIHVTVIDPDVVTEANIGRTLFAPSDIGEHKSSVLVSRINWTYGLNWHGIPMRYQYPIHNAMRQGDPPDVLITAVDSLRSRAEIYRQMLLASLPPPRYWLDMGNSRDTGQVVLGEPEWALDPWDERRRRRPRLRTIVDVFPDMLDRAEVEVEEPGSCSLMGALDRQGPTINRWMATAAFELLSQLFLEGGLDAHGAFVNAAGMRVNPILVAPPPAVVREHEAALIGTQLPQATERRARPRRRMRCLS
jgi:PRTRC genetic system ThiF family protein